MNGAGFSAGVGVGFPAGQLEIGNGFSASPNRSTKRSGEASNSPTDPQGGRDKKRIKPSGANSVTPGPDEDPNLVAPAVTPGPDEDPNLVATTPFSGSALPLKPQVSSMQQPTGPTLFATHDFLYPPKQAACTNSVHKFSYRSNDSDGGSDVDSDVDSDEDDMRVGISAVVSDTHVVKQESVEPMATTVSPDPNSMQVTTSDSLLFSGNSTGSSSSTASVDSIHNGLSPVIDGKPPKLPPAPPAQIAPVPFLPPISSLGSAAASATRVTVVAPTWERRSLQSFSASTNLSALSETTCGDAEERSEGSTTCGGPEERSEGSTTCGGAEENTSCLDSEWFVGSGEVLDKEEDELCIAFNAFSTISEPRVHANRPINPHADGLEKFHGSTHTSF